MQFHLNGFTAGDPLVLAASERALAHTGSIPPQVDVLIVGCGPAGLTLAAQLAAFPDIRTVIVEAKDGPIALGQADGIACRTMEMFEAFDFADRVLKEACWINEVTFWKPDMTNATMYSPGGRFGMTKSPFTFVTAVRVPWSAGDFAVTVTPGSARPSASATRPVMVPVGRPWASACAARRSGTRRATSQSRFPFMS